MGLPLYLAAKPKLILIMSMKIKFYALTIRMFRTPDSDGTADRSSFEYYSRDSAYGYPIALDQADSKASTGVFSG